MGINVTGYNDSYQTVDEPSSANTTISPLVLLVADVGRLTGAELAVVTITVKAVEKFAFLWGGGGVPFGFFKRPTVTFLTWLRHCDSAPLLRQ